MLYGVFTAVVLSPLDNLELDEETAKEIDEQGASIFIPFPGTIKQVQPLPYRGTDPEWQEYIKFSKDPALGKRIRGMFMSLNLIWKPDGRQMSWRRSSSKP
jgi:hypothetical protein